MLLPAHSVSPFLLTMGDYFGTLAAARCLGRAGIPVVLADASLLARAQWSRYVVARESCPPVGAGDVFVDALLELGRRSPGRVLYPTSDDTAFLFARRGDELARDYRLYQPPLSTVHALLDKKRLHGLCHEVGLDVPESVYPESLEDLDRLAPQLRYPVLIKPRTQVQLRTLSKGVVVSRPEDLRSSYVSFVRRNRHGPEVLAHDPAVGMPMLQRYQPEALEGIHSVSGFVDRSFDHAIRASVKVLQRPRRLGVGICFEAAPACPELESRLLDLCRRAGYHGVFEAEFIRCGDRSLLIDFNPRFYGQMGFEVARGLPLGGLVHAAAHGRTRQVHAALAQARASRPAPTAYCHRLFFELHLALQRLGARGEQPRDWRAWYRRHHATMVDAVYAPDDVAPSFGDALDHLARAARHPRAFFRSAVLEHT